MTNPRDDALAEIDRALCLRSLADFVRIAWPRVDPEPLVWGWHLDAVCEHLEAVTCGDLRRLLINIPPGHAKSLLVSVLWPAWIWTFEPARRALFASYAAQLSLRDAVRCRKLVNSDWYQKTFKPDWQMAPGQDTKSYYANTAGGERYSTSVGGSTTGFRGDTIVIDDPLPADEWPTDIDLDNVISWYNSVLFTRANKPTTTVQVIIMQRLHERDLSAHVLSEVGGFEHLMLPAEYDPERKSSTSIGWSDPRTESGDPLFPALYPTKVLDEYRRVLGHRGYASQFGQRPSPSEGSIIKLEWVKRYAQPPTEVRRHCSRVALSVDCTFGRPKTASKKRSWATVQAWGQQGQSFLLLGFRRGRWSFPDLKKNLREMEQFWRPQLRLVEARAAGRPAIEELSQESPGWVEYDPQGADKVARCEAASSYWESGNVFVPTELAAPWVGDWLDRVVSFPDGDSDDDVDAMSQILLHWGGGSRVHWMLREPMKEVAA